MKSSFMIQLDYQKTMRKAEELEGIAKDLRNLATQNFESTISRLKSNWTGEAADAYINKAKKVKSELEKSANNLQNAAATLKEIAVKTYNTEMKNLQLLSK